MQTDIAQAINVNESTVSRALKNKFVQTSFGTVPVSKFLSRPAKNTNNSVSLIKEAIRNVIKNENPTSPISDQEITDILNDIGICVPRRNVAKYRKELGFPNSYERKI